MGLVSQQALPIFQAVGDRNGEAGALLSRGTTYFSLSQSNQAIENYRQALTIFLAAGNRNGEAIALNSLGAAYASLSQYNQAIENYQQALVIFQAVGDRASEANALVNLGNAYRSLSQFDKAIEFEQKALTLSRQIGNRSSEARALNTLGIAYHFLTQYDKAIAHYQQALLILQAVGDRAGEGATLSNLGLTLLKTGDVRGAEKILMSAITLWESLRSGLTDENKISLLEVQANPYRTLQQAFIAQNNPQVDLRPLWQQHNASLSTLVVGNQEFLAVRSRSSLSFTKVQPNLPTLHQLLIDPIANLLPKHPNADVIFIPQGALFQVPFPALQSTNGTYLIQKHTILTAPSIQVLALTRQQQQKLTSSASHSGKALVLGNPTMPQISLSPGAPKRTLLPLPGAEAEAKAIAPLLRTQPIIGAQGTKAAVTQKMLQAPIIHLATHGLLDDVRGLGSAIALAPSGKDNGWLTAEDILDLRLQANLVILSACNTAAGRITGDGVIGLSRSLVAAGVPSVIVSLWSIPDASTAALMQAFYRNLQKNPDKAQALRQAMLTTMKTHPEPRDWAAFTLIGEAE